MRNKRSPQGKKTFNQIAMALFAFSARSLQQVATFVITLLAAKFLLPAEYGVYAVAIVFITMIQTLTYSGFYQWIVNSKEDDGAVLSTAFWMIFGLATGAALLLAAAAKPLSWAFDAPDLFGVLLLLALIQPVAGAGAWYSAALLRRGAVNTHFSILFAQNLIALIGGAVLLWMWHSIYALVAFRYFRVLTATVLYLLFSKDHPRFRFERSLVRHATSFSGGLYGARFLSFLSKYAGDLLLGLMFSTAEAGLYRFGNRVASGATDIIAQPLRSFALTQFGAGARKETDLAKPLERFVGGLVLLTGIVAAVIIVFAPRVIEDYFSPAYLAALVVTFAMAMRAVLSVGTLIIEPTLAAKDRTGLVAKFNLFWTICTVGAVFLAAPLGLTALAWSQAAVMLLTTLSAFWVLKRQDIDVSGAVRAFFTASFLAVVYGVILYYAWQLISQAYAAGLWTLVMGLFIASLIAVVTLFAGAKLRVFSLTIFSG